MAGNPITVKGKQFPSLAAAARHHGLPASRVEARLKSGIPTDEAFGPDDRRIPDAAIFDGTPCPSIMALAQHLGEKKPQSFYARRQKRNAPLDALTWEHVRPRVYEKGKGGAPVEIDGQVFPTIDAACRTFGVSRATRTGRARKGWTLRQQLGIDPPPPRKPRQHKGAGWCRPEIANGRTGPGAAKGEYKLYEMTCRANGKIYIGITIGSLKVRLNGHAQCARKGNEAPIYRAIRKHGRENFTIRLLRNDASNTEELQQQEIDAIQERNATDKHIGYNVALGGWHVNGKAVTVGGHTFPTVAAAAAAEHFGISYAALVQRLQVSKWTPEQAAEIEPPPTLIRKRRASHS